MFKQVNHLVFFLIITIGFSQEISTCINITSSGTYYLISDILDSSATPCIIISASDVVFDGQNHSLDGIDASSSYGIYISSNLKNITIQDIRISDWERGIYVSTTSNLTRIMSAEVFSNVYGIFLQGDFHVVANSKIYSNTDTGIRINGKNNQISNNLIYFNGVRELYLSGNNATVYNNSFNSTGGGNYGIYCDSCGNSNIFNNTLINYRYGVYSRYCGTSTYSNNRIVGNAEVSYGIYIYHYGSKDYSNITDNRIGSVYRGIHFDSTRGGQRIENNVINSTFLDIQISPPSETWTDDFCSFQFNNNSGSGNLPIKFFNNSVNLENDVLSELILCGAHYSNITNITIHSPDGNLNNGFIILGTNFTKLMNINSSNNYYGVAFVGPINNLTIVNSSFNLNTYGIYDSRGLSTFRKSYISLTNNSILNNTYSVSAVLYNSLLSNNLIANNSYGIILEGDGTLLINNTIQNNVKSGNYEIDCRGSDQSIDGNLIQSYKTGIRFYYTTGGVIKNNLLFGAGSSTGIVLDSSSQNALIANNNVSSFYYGIQVVIGSSNHTISSNKIYFNNYCGIEIYPSSYYINQINVTENEIYNNSNCGIRIINSGNNIIYNNNISSNSYGLILGYSSRDNSIISNMIYLNKNGTYVTQSSNNFFINNYIHSNVFGLYAYSISNYSFVNTLFGNNTWNIFFKTSASNNNSFINTTISGMSFQNQTLVDLEVYLPSANLSVQPIISKPSDPQGFKSLNKHLDISAYGSATIFISYPYDTSELGKILESSLRVARYNGTWETNCSKFASDCGVDFENKRVYANITSLGSIFTIIGEQDETPPSIIEGPNISVTHNSSSIFWSTDELSNYSFAYTDGIHEWTISSDNLSLEHFIILENLKEGTSYHFNITIYDGVGNNRTYENYSFTTLKTENITIVTAPENLDFIFFLFSCVFLIFILSGIKN